MWLQEKLRLHIGSHIICIGQHFSVLLFSIPPVQIATPDALQKPVEQLMEELEPN